MTAAIEEKNVISHCACCGCLFYDQLEMYWSDKTFDFAVCKSCFDAIEKKQWNGIFHPLSNEMRGGVTKLHEENEGNKTRRSHHSSTLP